ncbi:hypothetical protein FB451DRAFT_1016214, partial [Mycena latifolia]
EPYPITLPADIRDVSVRRDFMRIHYGGNSQDTFPAISEINYTRTGHRYFMYPSLKQNPDAPMMPGSPGLFLDAAGRSALKSKKPWAAGYNLKVLTRLGTNDFLYMGEYAIRPADSLAREEWTAQTQTMKNKWCKNLAKKDWGLITRARIALRRQLGRAPTFKQVETAIANDQKFPAITAGDIAQAFDNGDERLAVWTMECVGYDEQFQRDLVRQITGWVPPPPKPKNLRKGRTVQAGSKAKRAPKKTAPNAKRVQPRRTLTVDSDDESDGD